MERASKSPAGLSPSAAATPARRDEGAGGAAAAPAGYAVLDVVRAIAALAVVWNHAWNMVAGPMPSDAGPLLHLAYISAGFGIDAVFAFFVVSGFWIGKSVVSRLDGGGWSWANYLVDRLSRLLIVLLPALLLGGLLDWLGSALLGLPIYRNIHVIGTGGFAVENTLNVSTLLGNLLFLQGIICQPFGSNVVLWSLSYEFWFYIWLPILLKPLWRLRFGLAELAVAVFSVLFLRLFLLAFPVWLLGCAAYWAFHRPRWDRPLPERTLGWAGLLAAAVIWLAFLLVSHVTDAGFLATGWLTAIGALPLMAIVGRLRLPGLGILGRLAAFGAGSSFSLYAMHFPLLVLLIGLLPAELRTPAHAGVIAPLLVAVSVAAAFGFSRLTEYQTPRFRRWLRTRLARG